MSTRPPPSWLERPQRIPLRRALFQIHLWLGIGLGLYVLLISVSGSIAVFRRDLSAWLIPRSVPAMVGERLTGDALQKAVAAAYDGYEITSISASSRPERPIFVVRMRAGERSERLFDPYAGADLGNAYPPTVRAMEWVVDLHDNLLTGSAGRRANGIASALVLALIMSGAVIWWPGRSVWRQSVAFPHPVRNRRFMWQTHSALGFWSLALLGVWAVTGIYFAFPDPFTSLTAGAEVDGAYVVGRGEKLLEALIALHFGRFGGMEVRLSWMLLGLAPAVLWLTGFILWWRRVMRRYLVNTRL